MLPVAWMDILKSAKGFANRDEKGTRAFSSPFEASERLILKFHSPYLFPFSSFIAIAGYDSKPPSRPYDSMPGGGGGNGGFAPPPFNGASGGKNKPVDERVQHERPCRTLFVRNVNYDADSSKIKADFERYGDIKTFFDIINNRGMAFITYFDLRAAEEARNGMHDSLVNGRPGSLMLRLKSGRPIISDEVRRRFSVYGPIREIRNASSPDIKLIEYFDARHAVDAHDAMNNRPFQDSEVEVRFTWDHPDIARSSVPARSSRGRGGRGRAREDRGGHRERSPDRGYARSGPYSSDRSRRRSSDAGTVASSITVHKDPSARLDEAKKIQDLLASLSQGGLAVPPAAPQPTYGAPINAPPPAQSFRPPTDGSRSGYNAYPGQPPPQPAYTPSYQIPAAHTYAPPPPAPAVVPPGAAVNPAFANPASVAPVRPGIPISSGYGQHPHLSAATYQPSYPLPSRQPPMMPPSMNSVPSSMPPYGSQHAAAPPPALPLAGGMSDLLALLAAQQKR
ncbi:hypothetical protein QFC21_003602 [Naganishia friedmannii]|uniref:Uncharacterized protein n=1 Tax=Naganishia friedmannii TaxID=89922 RepID=A0ACC2VNK9_9TREE|nr:hypothetical protein QFC21_003602 [Naganishia friedmannii]